MQDPQTALAVRVVLSDFNFLEKERLNTTPSIDSTYVSYMPTYSTKHQQPHTRPQEGGRVRLSRGTPPENQTNGRCLDQAEDVTIYMLM